MVDCGSQQSPSPSHGSAAIKGVYVVWRGRAAVDLPGALFRAVTNLPLPSPTHQGPQQLISESSMSSLTSVPAGVEETGLESHCLPTTLKIVRGRQRIPHSLPSLRALSSALGTAVNKPQAIFSPHWSQQGFTLVKKNDDLRVPGWLSQWSVRLLISTQVVISRS